MGSRASIVGAGNAAFPRNMEVCGPACLHQKPCADATCARLGRQAFNLAVPTTSSDRRILALELLEQGHGIHAQGASYVAEFDKVDATFLTVIFSQGKAPTILNSAWTARSYGQILDEFIATVVDEYLEKTVDFWRSGRPVSGAALPAIIRKQSRRTEPEAELPAPRTDSRSSVAWRFVHPVQSSRHEHDRHPCARQLPPDSALAPCGSDGHWPQPVCECPSAG